MRRALGVLVALAALLSGCVSSAPPAVLEENYRYGEAIELPDPAIVGTTSLEEALQQRRSRRDYSAEELSVDTIGQLFWAGQGVTESSGYRTAPSAGATYPLELYAITSTRIMHYLPAEHDLEWREDLATLNDLADVAFDQGFVGSAPVVLVITGIESRTAHKYGALAGDFTNREAGHAAQNILLQAAALDLAIVPVGGFDPALVARMLRLRPGEEVLYLIPVGYPVPPSR